MNKNTFKKMPKYTTLEKLMLKGIGKDKAVKGYWEGIINGHKVVLQKTNDDYASWVDGVLTSDTEDPCVMFETVELATK